MTTIFKCLDIRSMPIHSKGEDKIVQFIEKILSLDFIKENI